MTKVNGIWRMLAMVFVGMVLGILISYAVLNKATSGDGQNITIGKLKIKNSTDNTIDLTQDSQDDNSKKKRLKRRK